MPCVFRMDLMTRGVSIRGQGLAEATLRGDIQVPCPFPAARVPRCPSHMLFSWLGCGHTFCPSHPDLMNLDASCKKKLITVPPEKSPVFQQVLK